MSTREQDLEVELREEWAFNHGCPTSALYGDDGELQCSACMTDWRREPFVDLRSKRFMLKAKAMQDRATLETSEPSAGYVYADSAWLDVLNYADEAARFVVETEVDPDQRYDSERILRVIGELRVRAASRPSETPEAK